MVSYATKPLHPIISVIQPAALFKDIRLERVYRDPTIAKKGRNTKFLERLRRIEDFKYQ